MSSAPLLHHKSTLPVTKPSIGCNLLIIMQLKHTANYANFIFLPS